jgi:hypothetical protein
MTPQEQEQAFYKIRELATAYLERDFWSNMKHRGENFRKDLDEIATLADGALEELHNKRNETQHISTVDVKNHAS